MPTAKRPTIADVAREASVSVPTVSRVLTGAAPVSADKSERVRAAQRKLGYQPSATARSLAEQRPWLLSIVTSNTSRYGYAETIRGIEESVRAAGYTASITVVESDATEDVERAAKAILAQPVLGAVVLKFDPEGVAVLDALPDYLPVVAVSGPVEESRPQVLLDEERSAHDLVEYLLDLGHTTVHHVTVPPSRRGETAGRTNGWRRALQERGIPVPAATPCGWDPVDGVECGRALAQSPEVTAVFCGNDEIAMGVIRGLHERGREVPGDVSVVGFDDHPLSRVFTPTLTTVNQDFAGLGSCAFDLVEQLACGTPVYEVSTQVPALVVRESSAPPSGHH